MRCVRALDSIVGSTLQLARGAHPGRDALSLQVNCPGAFAGRHLRADRLPDKMSLQRARVRHPRQRCWVA